MTVISGASLELSPTSAMTAAITFPYPIILSGAGFNGTGALISATSATFISGGITFMAAATIDTATNMTQIGGQFVTPNTTTIASGTYSTENLTKIGANTLFVQVQNAFFYGSVYVGNNEEFNGNDISAGNLDIGGGNAGFLGAGDVPGTGYFVNPGGTLTLDDALGPQTFNARLNGASNVTLNGGTLSFVSYSGSSDTNDVGPVILGPGNSVIVSTESSSNFPAVLNIPSLAGSGPGGTILPGETVNFSGGSGTALGNGTTTTNQIQFGAPLPSTITTNQGVIVPYATELDLVGTANLAQQILNTFTGIYNVLGLTAATWVTAPVTNINSIPTATFAANVGTAVSGTTITVTAANTFSAGQVVMIAGLTPAADNGVFTLTSANSTSFAYADTTAGIAISTTAGTATVFDVVDPTSNAFATPTASTTIAALILPGTITSTLAAGVTLTVSSGAILSAATSNTIAGSGTLAFGSAEGVVSTYPGITTTISSVLTGSGGFVATGIGTFAGTLTLTEAAGNPGLTGPTTLEDDGAAGTLTIANGGDLGTGTLNLINGILTASAASAIFNPVTIDGTVILGGSGAMSFHGAVTLAGNSSITQSDSGGVTVYGPIGDGGNAYTLSLAGGSTLTLDNANTYTGGTVLANTGTLTLGNNNALSNGPVTVAASNTLTSSVSVTLPNVFTLNPVTPPGVTAANITTTISGANPITFGGAVTLTGASIFSVSNTGGVYFNGGIAGSTPQNSGALTLTGAGIVFLPVANTYADGTTITSTGTVVVGNANSFGPGLLSLTGGAATTTTTLAAASAVAFNNPVLLNPLNTTGSFTFAGANLSFTGVTTLANTTASILTFNNSTTFSGPISSLVPAPTNGLTIAGTGTLTLSGPNTFANTAATGITLNMTNAAFGSYLGTLALGSNAALGATTNMFTLTNGNLQASGSNGIFVPNPLTIGSATGAFIGFTGSQSLTFYGTAATISTGTTTFTNTNTVPYNSATGIGGVNFAGPVTANVTATIFAGTGSTVFTATNSMAGTVTINGGVVVLGGNAAGSTGTLASTTFTIGNGGSLVLDNTLLSSPSPHLTGTPALNLNGGNFTMLGNANPSGADNESLSNLTLGVGNVGGASTFLSVVPFQAGLGFTDVSVAFSGSLIRAAGSGATIDFEDNANSSNTNSALGTTLNKVSFGTLPTTGGIVPFATYNNGSDFVGSNFNGVQAYSNVGSYNTSGVLSVNNTVSTLNFKDSALNASDSITSNTTVNALVFSGGGTATLSIPTGVTLTLTSGALLVTNNTALTITGGGTLALGEGIITTASGSSLTVGGTTSGAGTTALSASNIAFSGSGTVTLTSPNAITGSTALNAGTLIINNLLALGAGALILNGGTFQSGLTNGLVVTNALTLGNSNITLGGNGYPLTFTGLPAMTGTVVTLNIPNSNDSSLFTGSATGAVFLTKNGSGTLTLTGTNAFTLFNVNAGTVVSGVGATATALGAATGAAVVASGVALVAVSGSSAYTSAPTVTFSGGGAATQATGTATISGVLTSVSIGSSGGTGYTNGTVNASITGGGGSGAAATVTIFGGAVTAVNITAGGSGYTAAPTITFSSGTPTIASTLTGSLTTTVTSVTITNPGFGYTSAPLVAFSGGGATTQVTGIVSITTPKIQIQQGTTSTKPLVLNGGTALQWLGGGTGAAASSGAILLQANTTIDVPAGSLALSGVISGPGSLTKTSTGFLQIAAAGVNAYFGGTTVSAGILELAPSVVANGQALGQIVNPVTVASGATLSLNPVVTATIFTGYNLILQGTGVGDLASGNLLLARGALVYTAALAAATWTGNITLAGNTTINAFTAAADVLTINGIVSDNGPVTSANVTAGGSGYTAVPNVSISGGGGSGATAVATISGGAVTGITITNNGSGYTAVPTIQIGNITSGGGLSAAATAVISASLTKVGGGTWSWLVTTRLAPAAAG